jgi:hypothetical protein
MDVPIKKSKHRPALMAGAELTRNLAIIASVDHLIAADPGGTGTAT